MRCGVLLGKRCEKGGRGEAHEFTSHSDSAKNGENSLSPDITAKTTIFYQISHLDIPRNTSKNLYPILTRQLRCLTPTKIFFPSPSCAMPLAGTAGSTIVRWKDISIFLRNWKRLEEACGQVVCHRGPYDH